MDQKAAEQQREWVLAHRNNYIAEVMNCVAHGKQFKIELELIQYQDN
jgi:hypothetical protein